MQRIVLLAFLAIFSIRQLDAQQQSDFPESVVFACSVQQFEQFKNNFLQTSFGKYLSHSEVRKCLRIDHGKKRNPVFELFVDQDWGDNAFGVFTFAIIKKRQEGSKFVLMIEQLQDESSEALATKITKNIQSKRLGDRVFLKQDNGKVAISDDRDLVDEVSGKNVLQLFGAISEFNETVIAASKKIPEHDFWVFAKPLALVNQKQWADDKYLSLARTEGVDAIKCLGGVGTLQRSGVTNFVGSIVADKPFRRGMRLLDLENDSSSDVACGMLEGSSSGFIRLKVDGLTESFSTVFDALIADGEQGVFEGVLSDLKTDASGPRIDIHKELIGNLESPAYFCTRSNSAKPESAICMELRDVQVFSHALKRFYQGDEKARKLERAYDVWEITPLAIDGEAKDSYAVAIKDGYFWIGTTVTALSRAKLIENDKRSSTFSKVDSKLDSFSVGYQLDLGQMLMQTHENLQDGKLGRLLDTAATNLKISIVVDKQALPDFKQLGDEFNSRLKLLGKNTSRGWDFVMQID